MMRSPSWRWDGTRGCHSDGGVYRPARRTVSPSDTISSIRIWPFPPLGGIDEDAVVVSPAAADKGPGVGSG